MLLGLVMTSVHACIVSNLLTMEFVQACHACVCTGLAGSSAVPGHCFAVAKHHSALWQPRDGTADIGEIVGCNLVYLH